MARWEHTICHPHEIAKSMRHLRDGGKQMTLLVGAGFSASAGIPLAGQVVKEYLRPHPLLRGTTVPTGENEYAFLMGKLRPQERFEIIQRCIADAMDGDPPRSRLNWAHLLAAALVYHGYVGRILTTNFDPLLVDAMAITDQPVYTFDLMSSSQYTPGRAAKGSIVYLHGQAHGLFQAHAQSEMSRVKPDVKSAVQEALGDSPILVVGYSGLDPVFDILRDVKQFRHGLYWTYYDPGKHEPPDHIKQLVERDGCEVNLVCDDGEQTRWLSADAVMHRIVIDHLRLSLPPLIRNPFDHMRRALERFCAGFDDPRGASVNPVEHARAAVDRAERQFRNGYLSSLAGQSSGPSERDGRGSLQADALAIAISQAGLTRDIEQLRQLVPEVERGGGTSLREAVGSAYIWIVASLAESEWELKGRLLDEASPFLENSISGPSKLAFWRGVASANRAKQEKSDGVARQLFTKAEEYFKEAIALGEDGGTVEIDLCRCLLDRAGREVQEHAAGLYERAGKRLEYLLSALPHDARVPAMMGEALIGIARVRPAERFGQLLDKAEMHLKKALDQNPHRPRFLYLFAGSRALRGDVPGAIEAVGRWLGSAADADLTEINSDPCFERVRAEPQFVEFLDRERRRAGLGKS